MEQNYGISGRYPTTGFALHGLRGTKQGNALAVRLFAPDAAQLPPQDQLMEFDTSVGKKWLHLQMPETAPA